MAEWNQVQLYDPCFLQELLGATTAGIGFLQEGRFTCLDEQLARLTGYAATDLLGSHWRRLFADQDGEGRSDLKDFSLASGRLTDVAARWLHRDGTVIEVLLNTIPHPEKGSVLKVLDLTAAKAAERAVWSARQQLIRAERLGTIGSLVGSIVHEINNPFCGIHSVIERLARERKRDEADSRLVELALDECERLKRLLRTLQQLHLSGGERVQAYSIHGTIDSVLLLLNKHLKLYRAKVETVYGADPATLRGVEPQIRQVLLSLLKNRCASLGKKGGLFRIRTWHLENKVHIELSDDGEAIGEEQLASLFEPFFSTRPERHDLGLSVAYSIVRAHGGEIRVTSTQGQRTTFTVQLPVENLTGG